MLDDGGLGVVAYRNKEGIVSYTYCRRIFPDEVIVYGVAPTSQLVTDGMEGFLFLVTSPLREEDRKNAISVIASLSSEALEIRTREQGREITPEFLDMFSSSMVADLQTKPLHLVESIFVNILKEVFTDER